ncbi:MAG: glycerophosphodiester phosphodiesterase [Frankiales bacterium]|nr:glycerophosphodiester phosphodiesterase [Frankiales bacterium]
MTEVVAHRGSSADEPEHTLGAYVRAIAEGADALECDVRLTADGHLVCVHDRRIDRTGDMRGVVSVMTLEDLSRVDFGRWREPGQARPSTAGPGLDDPVVYDEDRRRVLTLERLLELVVDSEREVGLAIETKHPTRYAGLVEERTVELLRRFGLARPRAEADRRVRVMSFSQLSVRRLRALAPGLPTVFLMDRVALRLRDGSLPFGAVVAGPSIQIVRAHPSYVERLHRRGHAVHVWTVDEPADVDLCLELGVDAIITNRPREVLGHLGRLPSAPQRAAAPG